MNRPTRIVVVGAGPSGLLLAYKLQRSLGDISLQVFEKNPGVSGTWHENRYPGCASDLPALNYTYTFEPKYEWASSYACAAEIKDYFVGFCEKYGLAKYVKTEHKVCGARWLDNRGLWCVRVEDLRSRETKEHECDFFVNAGGYLNDPKIPDTLDPDLYQGTVVHSAVWDETLDLQGKKVALIGNSASGVQILPAIQPIAKHITFLMRSPTWLLPPLGIDQQTDNKSAIRVQNEATINTYFSHYFSNIASQTAALAQYNEAIRNYIPAHLPADLLFPSSGSGCKRIVPPPSYLPSLHASNVTAVAGSLTSFTRTGFTYDTLTPSNTETSTPTSCQDIDIVILATGFHTHHLPRYPIYGLNALNMQQAWDPSPRSYLGLATPAFPNFFTLLGPYSPTMNGTTLPGLEAQVGYILQVIARYQRDSDVHSITPKTAAANEFLRHLEEWMEGRPWLWAREVRSPLREEKKGSGMYPRIWPGTTTHYRQAIRHVRWDDWEVRYKGSRGEVAMDKSEEGAKAENQFSWLGDGICKDRAEELGGYLRESDEQSWVAELVIATRRRSDVKVVNNRADMHQQARDKDCNE